MKLNRVNDFLSKLEPIPENELVLDGTDVMKNILVSEVMDISRLSRISQELVTYLSKDLKNLSRKDQQSFWRDVETVLARKEDWFFKVTQEANKNNFVKQILDITNQSNEKVISENGEVFDSSITDENRTQLSALLVDLLNDTNRG
jgi:uncharacterized NAD(P)/FAD-binding protein YdhS